MNPNTAMARRRRGQGACFRGPDCSERLMARPGAAFDGGGGEAIDVEAPAELLEHGHLVFIDNEIGGRDVAGDGIGGFQQLVGKVLGDDGEHGVETVFISQQGTAGLGNLGQFVLVETVEGGEVAHDIANGLEFLVVHAAIGSRNQNHGVDQRGMGIELGHCHPAFLDHRSRSDRSR